MQKFFHILYKTLVPHIRCKKDYPINDIDCVSVDSGVECLLHVCECNLCAVRKHLWTLRGDDMLLYR